jgi:hypothetical protein
VAQLAAPISAIGAKRFCHDGCEMKLVSRSRKPSKPHPLETSHTCSKQGQFLLEKGFFDSIDSLRSLTQLLLPQRATGPGFIFSYHAY